MSKLFNENRKRVGAVRLNQDGRKDQNKRARAGSFAIVDTSHKWRKRLACGRPFFDNLFGKGLQMSCCLSTYICIGYSTV